MKLQELQASIGRKRGRPVSLGSLKVCLSRYVDTSDASKLLTRVAPGLFALSEWAASGRMFGTHSNLAQRDSLDQADRETSRFVSHSSSAPSRLFLWTAPADEATEEQRVYVRAATEEEALSRLEFAGVYRASVGSIRPI